MWSVEPPPYILLIRHRPNMLETFIMLSQLVVYQIPSYWLFTIQILASTVSFATTTSIRLFAILCSYLFNSWLFSSYTWDSSQLNNNFKFHSKQDMRLELSDKIRWYLWEVMIDTAAWYWLINCRHHKQVVCAHRLIVNTELICCVANCCQW